MLLYTITGSLPLLAAIGILEQHSISNLRAPTQWVGGSTPEGLLWGIALCLGFIVKFPLYGVHLWLPQAHVEAPVVGSIVLAAMLLKLGGLGLFRLITVCPANSMMPCLQVYAILGGSAVSLLCVAQLDAKVLVAYSSVAHMGVVISSLLRGTCLGRKAATIIIVSHGLSASAMFAGADVLYQITHSRNLLVIAGFTAIVPRISATWFVCCLANISAPPTLNFLGEILGFIVISALPLLALLGLASVAFIRAAYNFLLYMAPFQRQTANYPAQRDGKTQIYLAVL